MRGTARPRVLVVLATTVGLAATGLAVAPTAHAGPPGHWTRLTTSHGVSLTIHPSLVRLGSKLEVVWSQSDSSSADSIRVRAVSAAGKADPTIHTVVSGWASITTDPAVIAESGHLLVAFGGLRTNITGEKYSTGAMAYATSPNAASWTLGDGFLTHTRLAYGDYGTGAVDDSGTPFVALAAGSSTQVTTHRGIDKTDTVPDAKAHASGDDVLAVNVAIDRKTHAIWAAWYDLGTTTNGVYYQQVYPTSGALHYAPGSRYKGNSLSPLQNVAMTSRPGGGVYLAYEVGYPSATKIRVLKAGTSSYHDVPAYQADAIALGAGVGGRIWVAWRGEGSTVKAARSTVSVSRFGSVVSVPGPTAKYGYSVTQLSIDGSRGPLDVVANSGVPNTSYSALYHTQLYAPLTVKLSRTSVKSSTGGSVTVTVTEAGAAVVGAKVVFNGVTVKTNSHGKAVVKVKKHAATGKKTLTVSLKYYVTKRLTIKVT